MKSNYEMPQMMVHVLVIEDIVTVSGGGKNPFDPDYGGTGGDED